MKRPWRKRDDESCEHGVATPPKDERRREFKSPGTCGTLRRVNTQHRKHPPRKSERHASLFARLWGLFFATNDRFITYQQRRNWRARASFFFVLGVVLTLVVQWFLQSRGLLVVPLAR